METLKPESINSFLKRFSEAHDGVIHSIQLFYSSCPPLKAQVNIEVMDVENWVSGEDIHWAGLTLIIDDVIDYIWVESNQLTNVVIYELGIGFIDDIYYLDFSNERDADTAEGFRKSKGLISGRKVSWEATPL